MVESNSRIAILEKYLREDPSDDFTLYALALEYASSGLQETAVHHLQQLIERNPDYLAAYYQCGKLFESAGKNDNAAAMYRSGITVAQKQGNVKTSNELRSALELLD